MPIVVGALVSRVVIAVGLGAARREFDIWNFWMLGSYIGRPYVDFQAEYPVATVALFRAIAELTPGRDGFGRLLILLNFCAELGIAGLLWWSFGRKAACYFLLAGTAMVALTYTRADAFSTLGATAAIALWRKDKPLPAGGFLGLAVMTKLWPGPLVLLSIGDRLRTRRSRLFLLGAGGAGGVLAFCWLGIGGWDGIRQVVSYRGADGWQIETIPGFVLHTLDPGRYEHVAGADRIGEVSGVVRVALLITSLSVASWAIVRGARQHLLGLGYVVAVAGLLVFATLLSPQFLFWMLPGAAIAWVQGQRTIALLVAAAAWLSGIEMLRWHWYLQARPTWLLLVGLRNVLLVCVLALGARELLRRRSDPDHAGLPGAAA